MHISLDGIVRYGCLAHGGVRHFPASNLATTRANDATHRHRLKLANAGKNKSVAIVDGPLHNFTDSLVGGCLFLLYQRNAKDPAYLSLAVCFLVLAHRSSNQKPE